MKHELPGGAAWSAPARAGTLITLTALAAGANASVLIIGADRLDRLNIPDTLKSQMSARIKSSMVLMSDRGTALATVISSSLDWHDCLGGFGHDRHLERFGRSSYAKDANDWRRSARTGLISELTKHGFGEADVHGCINFFSKVGIDSGATLAFVPDHAAAGDNVVLRAEQDLLLFISTAPHPLSNQPWPPGGVAVEISADDGLAPHLELRDEAVRALEQTRWLVG
ncbi:MAG TPA: DUF1989 domain-containing protein [Kribbella sp.]|uniref:DUF1989 domain-containing protein n=1 Tax=Kribbella sp. TaxID=1871183 RepID=UPI002D77AC95|nr:DUF1989 domain-containing protein [Kribbella sp.]HET6298803.1 DUF1989 domain-containing protein [Kribbella sp.]